MRSSTVMASPWGPVVGDGQGIGDGVLGEVKLVQLPIELENWTTKRAPQWLATWLQIAGGQPMLFRWREPSIGW
jgi:hypothetical protein